ncbi:MAG TPA: 3-isopropylmalate dehydratase small subunit [Vicinamibacterales bacterium]|nr:3-isopropylmalate dehydratase small subunit [Vicinamibacterales bacterium]
MTELPRIERIAGPALVMRGNDIDTDRIVPARFLRAVTFEGLEEHLFEDDRREAAGRGATHPFDDVARRHAHVLLVNANFGCGSSREHAPQALLRRGIRAVVGESFAEIFFTNALTIGLPCVTASHADVERLMTIADGSTDAEIAIDLKAGRVSSGSLSADITLPDTARHALVSGTWDATALLLENYSDVEQAAAKLPYLQGF